jgi:hypothetical protein
MVIAAWYRDTGFGRRTGSTRRIDGMDSRID